MPWTRARSGRRTCSSCPASVPRRPRWIGCAGAGSWRPSAPGSRRTARSSGSASGSSCCSRAATRTAPRRWASFPAGRSAWPVRRRCRTSAGTRWTAGASTRRSRASPRAPTSTSSTPTWACPRASDGRAAILAETDHGSRFVSAVARGRLLGVQFHPERSGANGLRLIANVVAWARDRPARARRLMLTRRVIPCLDVANGRVVKGTQLRRPRRRGRPARARRALRARGRRRDRVPRHHRRPGGPRHPARHRRAHGAARLHPADRGRRRPERRRHARRPPGRRRQGQPQHPRRGGSRARDALRGPVRQPGGRGGDRRPARGARQSGDPLGLRGGREGRARARRPGRRSPGPCGRSSSGPASCS